MHSRYVRAGALAFVLVLAPLVRAQDPSTPDRRGEVILPVPAYQGRTANAPIPPEQHVRNEGGSDGSGLCVIASILANGQYQRVPGLEGGKQSRLWQTAKSRPGGYYPEKLEALVKQVAPNEKWASYYGGDTAVLKSFSSKGYPIGATMNTGRQYGYQSIAHMISLLHFDDAWACVADNNFVGQYSWMPAKEFERRWKDGDIGWAWIWTRMSPLLPRVAGLSVIVIASFVSASIIAFSRVAEAESEPSHA